MFSFPFSLVSLFLSTSFLCGTFIPLSYLLLLPPPPAFLLIFFHYECGIFLLLFRVLRFAVVFLFIFCFFLFLSFFFVFCSLKYSTLLRLLPFDLFYLVTSIRVLFYLNFFLTFLCFFSLLSFVHYFFPNVYP